MFQAKVKNQRWRLMSLQLKNEKVRILFQIWNLLKNLLYVDIITMKLQCEEAVDCIFDNEFFQIISEQKNRYHLQNEHKYKANSKQGKWKNVACSEKLVWSIYFDETNTKGKHE